MRILVHTINYRPELTGIGKFTAEMCEWLANRGHEVAVIAPPPYYPQWRVDPSARQWRYRTSVLDGVRVRRAPIWVPSRPGGIARVLYALSFAVSSFPLLLWEALRRPDLVLVIEPSFLNSPCAWFAARLGGARAWLHVQDLEVDLAYSLGQLRRGRRIAGALESWMIRRFDVVSSISRRMLARVRTKGPDQDRLFLLPNWFEPKTIFPEAKPSPLREKLGIPPDATVAMYAGSLGAKQGVEMILEAARELAGLPIHFVISGNGIAEEALKSAAIGMAQVSFLPLQPAQDLNMLLNLADVHLLPQRQGAAESVFPSKLIGMLASGRPLIAMAGVSSEVAELVDGCGIRVNHGDLRGFVSAIRRLAGNPDQRRRLGEVGRQRALLLFRQERVMEDFEAEALSRCPGAEPLPLRPKHVQFEVRSLADPVALPVRGSASSQNSE